MVQFGFSGSSRGLDVMPMSGLVAAIVMFPPLCNIPVDTLADQRWLNLFGWPIQKKRTGGAIWPKPEWLWCPRMTWR